MAEPVLYWRGPLPLSGVDTDVVEDAKFLLEFDLATLSRAAAALDQYPGFLDHASLASVIRAVVEDRAKAERLAGFLSQMHRILRQPHQTLDRVIRSMDEWRGRAPNKGTLPDDQFQELIERLRVIVKLYPGLARLEKARYVSTATGLELEDVQLLCDLRPVFDKERKSVEGYIPITTLKVICTGADGLPVTLEARLSPKDVAMLLERAETASKKLSVLRREVEKLGSRIPAVGMTRQEAAHG